MELPLPLAGIRVVDLTSLLPGPYCTMILGDFGADVIKVERPPAGDPGRGSLPVADGISMRHLMVNRNKRSIALDLKDDEDRATMRALCETADVIVEGFRPGTMARLGLDYETLSAFNPGLVYCSISGFGSVGASSPPAHDLNFMALAGMLVPDLDSGRCQLPPTQYADLAGGSLRAVIGILLALLARRTSGVGQYVDVGMLDGALGLHVEALAYVNGGQPAVPGDTRLTGRYPCYSVYRTRDGRFMTVGATEPAFWKNLCAVLDLPGFVDQQYAEGEAGRVAKSAVAASFAARTAAEWETLFDGVECCCSPVLTPGEAISRAALRDPSPLFEDEIEAGRTIRQFVSPVSLSRTPAAYRRPAPGCDEDRDEIVAELQALAERSGDQ